MGIYALIRAAGTQVIFRNILGLPTVTPASCQRLGCQSWQLPNPWNQMTTGKSLPDISRAPGLQEPKVIRLIFES